MIYVKSDDYFKLDFSTTFSAMPIKHNEKVILLFYTQ